MDEHEIDIQRLHIHINIHNEQVAFVEFTELIIRPAPRKEMLIAGEDWPYDPERKAMRIEDE
ncbi:unnamed protein product [Brassica rapa subsp. trilocularis]